MEYLKIQGKTVLGGEIDVHGAKNSVLPILAGCVLIKGECILHNVPRLSDVRITLDILRSLGAKVKEEGSTLAVDTTQITSCGIPEEMMQELRSSIIFLGALTARCGKSCVYLPGGCEIGLRPIDLHLMGLKALGCRVTFDGNNICCSSEHAKAGRVVLPFPSVGATENIMLLSVFLAGTTTIVNAAREPEIVDLASFLNDAGASIHGAGTTTVVIEGVKELHPCSHTVIPDRILATTLMSLAAATGKEMLLKKTEVAHLVPLLPVFDEMGCHMYLAGNTLRLKPPRRLHRVHHIETRPYPGFPTDCQAPVMAALLTASGASVVSETIFENRFKHVPYLRRFGADITVNDRTAVVSGVRFLHGADAECTDLRGGAALVIAALAAEGVSYIKQPKHIDRGYETVEELLSPVGARITRIEDEEGKTKETESEKRE